MAVYRAWALATAGRDVVLLTRYNCCTSTSCNWPRADRDATRDHVRPVAQGLVAEKIRKRTATVRRGRAVLRLGRDAAELRVAGRRGDGTLVVDEGQNLPLGFYRLCRVLGVDVTVFADENQRIGTEETTLSEICRTLGAPGCSDGIARGSPEQP
ncbi:hypothetical protein GCM10020229_36430 [Kitasatospora albolonga]